jgi:hypothetical protein
MYCTANAAKLFTAQIFAGMRIRTGQFCVHTPQIAGY